MYDWISKEETSVSRVYEHVINYWTPGVYDVLARKVRVDNLVYLWRSRLVGTYWKSCSDCPQKLH